MNEEENQAIELLKIDCLITLRQINNGELFMIEDEEKRRISATQVLLNLIDKQQKEIEKLKECHFKYEELTGIDLLLGE